MFSLTDVFVSCPSIPKPKSVDEGFERFINGMFHGDIFILLFLRCHLVKVSPDDLSCTGMTRSPSLTPPSIYGFFKFLFVIFSFLTWSLPILIITVSHHTATANQGAA